MGSSSKKRKDESESKEEEVVTKRPRTRSMSSVNDGEGFVEEMETKIKKDKKKKDKKKHQEETIAEEENNSENELASNKKNHENNNNIIGGEKPKKKETMMTVTNQKAKPLGDFDISSQTLRNLEKRGITSLFEIQHMTFASIMEGKDVIGRARTGQGKTLAYCLPIIESLLKRKHDNSKRGRGAAVLVLCPTRELAIQVGDEFTSVAPHLKIVSMYGGVGYDAQISGIREGLDAIVGTPGRVCDFLEKNVLKLSTVQFLVLDEADRMLDMGFQDEMNKIFDSVKAGGADSSSSSLQTLLFSATLPQWVSGVAKKKMNNPVTIDLVMEGDAHASMDIDHMCLMATPKLEQRAKIINDLLQVYGNLAGDGRAIVFCATKLQCDELANSESLKVEVKAMHGDVLQASRERTLAAFRRGQIKVLVATDVAARGLDIKGVDLVINNGPPAGSLSKRADSESYVHRSGRTGRAGRKGNCITLYAPHDEQLIKDIERATGNTLRRIAAPQSKDMINAASRAAGEAIREVPESVRGLFTNAAKELIASMGNGDALSVVEACLARITGFMDETSVKGRSLMQSAEGFVTVQFTPQSGKPMSSKGMAFSALKNVFGEGISEGVRGMSLTKDSVSALFDLDCKHEAKLRSFIKENKSGSEFSFPSELPELQQQQQPASFGGGGRGGSYGGSRSPYGGEQRR